MQSIYRKYRPQTFNEIQDQVSVVKILSNAIKLDMIAHAYLFMGPRGTGKTTLARLFAKAVNCSKRKGSDPCGTCTSCKEITKGSSMNCMEIDAASYTGVDNIRQIRDEVTIPPTNAPYKIYIIDEVHMLSKGAFNALLKTLEEPPAHIIFILATTESHKVPETIRSRCQQFQLSRLSQEHITKKLEMIAKTEKISIQQETLELIALLSEGGMRDAESIFSQIITLTKNKKISQEEVASYLGVADYKNIRAFSLSLLLKPLPETLTLLDSFVASGYDIEVFTKRVILYLRKALRMRIENKELTKESPEMQKIIQETSASKLLKSIEELSKAYMEIRFAFLPELPLEVACVHIAPDTSEQLREISSAKAQQETPLSPPPPKNPPQNPESQGEEKSHPQETPFQKEKLPPAKNLSLENIKPIWGEFLVKIKEKGMSYSLAFSHSDPFRIENGNTLVLSTRYALHKDKINDQKCRLTGEEILATLIGSNISLLCLTDEESGFKREKTDREKDILSSPAQSAEETLSNALEVFGGNVVEA
jgi:DNA polymerase-3 subunit gamma/tau